MSSIGIQCVLCLGGFVQYQYQYYRVESIFCLFYIYIVCIFQQNILNLMYQKFNISRQYLADKIFIPQPPQQGQIWPNLNITVLPDYLVYIKQNLTKQEQILLSDYHLQTYLLQFATKPHPSNDFDVLTHQILTHIRAHDEFWAKNKRKGMQQQSQKMHQTIQQFHKDCKNLEELQNLQKYPQVQYSIPKFKRIQNDYIYIKNQYFKSGHRYTGNLYPWVAQFVIREINKDANAIKNGPQNDLQKDKIIDEKDQHIIENQQKIINNQVQIQIGEQIQQKDGKNIQEYQQEQLKQKIIRQKNEQLQKQIIKNINKQTLKKFIFEFIVNLAIKAKPKYKLGYQSFGRDYTHQNYSINYHTSNSYVNNLSRQIEEQIKKFNTFLQQNNIDTKSLSSLKQYYMIANTIFICKKLVRFHIEKQKDKIRMNDTHVPSKQEIGLILLNYNEKDQNQFEQYLMENSKQQILSDLVNRLITQNELNSIVQYVYQKQYGRILKLAQIIQGEQEICKVKWRGFKGTQLDIEKKIQQFNQIINHPQNTNRMKYKLQGSELTWTDQLYLKFLQSFLQFFNVPTNNKKIAVAMGKDIQPNHVKHVKGLYMRNMNTRIQNGQIGGGKKGIFESKIQFLKKDIQNFNIKWFKKQGKNKSRKLKRRKRRRRRENEDGQQHDSDY